jgi:hypothetical protein
MVVLGMVALGIVVVGLVVLGLVQVPPHRFRGFTSSFYIYVLNVRIEEKRSSQPIENKESQSEHFLSVSGLLSATIMCRDIFI